MIITCEESAFGPSERFHLSPSQVQTFLKLVELVVVLVTPEVQQDINNLKGPRRCKQEYRYELAGAGFAEPSTRNPDQWFFCLAEDDGSDPDDSGEGEAAFFMSTRNFHKYSNKPCTQSSVTVLPVDPAWDIF